MIEYNGIKLDYFGDTLNKLILKNSLIDVETLSIRRELISTTFDLPRTAVNEEAFGYITEDANVATPIGEAKIYIDGNIHSQGKIYVAGFLDDVIKCNYYGSGLDVIKTFKEAPLKEVISTKSSEAYVGSYWAYTDFHAKQALGTVISSQLDYFYSTPQARTTYDITKACPFFSTNSIITKMFNDIGITVESDFMTKDYARYLYYSNFEGSHLSSNLMAGSVNNITSTISGSLSLGVISLGNGMTRTGNRYYFSNDITSLKVDLKINIPENDDVNKVFTGFKIVSGGAIVFTSTDIELLTGDNDFKVDTAVEISSGDYLEFYYFIKLNGSLPINFDITVSDPIIQHDNIQASAIVTLRDYLGKGSQLDFLKNYLMFHNLVLLIKDNIAYIECQDKGSIYGESTVSLVDNEVDITDLVERNIDVSLDYTINKFILFKQGMLSQSGTNLIESGETNTVGSVFRVLNEYGQGTESYTVGFNSAYDGIDGVLLEDIGVDQPANNIDIGQLIRIKDKYASLLNGKDATGFLESWSEFICVQSDLTTYGDVNTRDYTNMNATTSSISVLATSNQTARYQMGRIEGVITLFEKTLELRKNNKVREIFLYDHKGTLVNFKTNYIINNKRYKLLSFEYDIISKGVIAQITLL